MSDPYARPPGWSPTLIGDQLEEERRTRTGAFARFALEDVEDDPAPAELPATAPLRVQAANRPRSQR